MTERRRPEGDDPAADRVSVGVVVVAGGTARRFGGADKTAALLRGRPLLAWCLDAVDTLRPLSSDGDVPVVVVGPADHAVRNYVAAQGRAITWTREEPVLGGPAAALAAGVGALPAAVEVVVVLAGDQPFASDAVALLVAALERHDCDAAVAVGPDGRRQPLLAAYGAAPLRGALVRDTRDLSMRELLTGLRVQEVPVPEKASLDVDDAQDLARAERMLREEAR